jgi:hypothetical protein
MDDVVETTEPAEPEVIAETADCADYTDLEPAPVYTDNAELEQLRAENQRLQEQIAQMANQPRPRRQRKPRKPRVERQEPITVNHEPLTVNRQSSSTMKAVGMVAAVTVALFVIYETGLLIPLGLIGLATGGILK